MQITTKLTPGQAPGTTQPTLPVDANEIKRRQRLAEALMSQGMQTERIRHPLEAVGHVMQTGVGAMWGDSARKADEHATRYAYEQKQAEEAKAQAEAQARHQALAQALQGQTGPRYERAQMLLSNPATAAQGADMALGLLKEDPLQRQLLQARIAKAQQGPALPEKARLYEYAKQNPDFAKWLNNAEGQGGQGKSLAFATLPDGTLVGIQGRESGPPAIYKLNKDGQPIQQLKGVSAHGNTLYDNFGRQVGDITTSLVGGEVAKGEGQTIAKARANLPQAKKRFELLSGNLQRLERSALDLASQPGLDKVVGGLYQAYAPNVSEEALNAQTNLENLKIKISGEVLSSMREASKTGGAVGQVTEREWPRLENMLANLDPRQGDKQFLKNLNEVVTYARDVQRMIREAYESEIGQADYGRNKSGPAAAPGGQELDAGDGFKLSF